MELYITGDTHGDFSRFRPESFYEQERLTKEDVILIAGTSAACGTATAEMTQA